MEKCKKESFLTKEFADKAIEMYNKKYNRKEGDKMLTNSYLCTKCNTWHLTSQDNYRTALYKTKKELHETKILLASREAELFKRIDEAKKLKLKPPSANNNFAIENLKLKKELERCKSLTKSFRLKFESKSKDFLNLKNFILKHNKKGSLDKIEEIIKSKFTNNGKS